MSSSIDFHATTLAAPRARARPGRPMNNAELAETLCALSSAVREMHRAHLKAFETLIPHAFMNEVLAYVGSCILDGAAKAGAERHAEVTAILDSLECGMAAGDRETRNVISISFVGDGQLEPFFDALKPHLGPRVLAQLSGK